LAHRFTQITQLHLGRLLDAVLGQREAVRAAGQGADHVRVVGQAVATGVAHPRLDQGQAQPQLVAGLVVVGRCRDGDGVAGALVSGSGRGMCRWYCSSTTSLGLYVLPRPSKARSAATHGGQWAPVNSSTSTTLLPLRPSNLAGIKPRPAFSFSSWPFSSRVVMRSCTLA